MTDRLRLIAERSIIYTPHHVAEHRGFFDEEELNVLIDYESGPGGSWLADVLAEGAADIARGGVWIPLMYREHLEHLEIFAGLCAKNPQVLLARTEIEQFSWEELYGRIVLLPAAATSQWMFFEGVLREAGVDLDRIKFVRDLEQRTTSRLWQSGFADFYLVGPPTIDALVGEGFRVATSLPRSGGSVPWSVYYSSREFANGHAEILARFESAITNALQWVHRATPKEIAEVVSTDFPEVTVDLLTRSISRMKESGVWPGSTKVSKQALTRYQGIIAAYGLMPETVPHDSIVRHHSRYTTT